MSKIYAITSTGKTEKASLDLRFGKAENIVLFYLEKKHYKILENPFKNSITSGADLIRFLKNEGVTVVITGEVGPKVSDLLKKEKLQLVLFQEEKTKVEDIIDRIAARKKK